MKLQPGSLFRVRLEARDDLGCQVLSIDEDQVCVVVVRFGLDGLERVPGMGLTNVSGEPPAQFVLDGSAELVPAEGIVAWDEWGGLLFDLESLAARTQMDEVGMVMLPLPDSLQELSGYPFFVSWNHPDGLVHGCRQALTELIEQLQAKPGDATAARYAFAEAMSRLNSLERSTALICVEEAHDVIEALEAVADAAGLEDLDVGEGRVW